MISVKLQIFLIVAIFVYFIVIFLMLRKEELDLKYTLIWFLTGIVLLILAIFPTIVEVAAKWIGIGTPVNAIFIVEAIFVLVILLSLTAIVSQLNKKNRRLTQSIALMKKRLNDLEERYNALSESNGIESDFKKEKHEINKD